MKKLSLFLVALVMILVSCKPEIENPTVVTKSVGKVTETTASILGEVISDGGAEVTSRGVCWNTVGNPSVLDNCTQDGTGIGEYTSNLTDLTPNTTYYVKAYAMNSEGISYGEEKTFTTVNVVAPTIVTKDVVNITKNSAESGGNVTSDGGEEVTARGVCWSTKENPTISDSHTTDGKGTGEYVSNMTGLKEGTKYYVRAYATNSKGTNYGSEISFRTNGHSYVDLGLSVKWATCNVGANSPEEYGDYFAWGEITPKETYTEDNCPTYELSKAQLKSQGYIDREGNLISQYDAARANWGGEWRMPTLKEMDELKSKCTWTWITQGDTNGYKVTGPNGNSIFLPAAGHRNGSSLEYDATIGSYWSSTPDEYDMYYYYDNISWYLEFRYEGVGGSNISYRSYGNSVRPVIE